MAHHAIAHIGAGIESATWPGVGGSSDKQRHRRRPRSCAWTYAQEAAWRWDIRLLHNLFLIEFDSTTFRAVNLGMLAMQQELRRASGSTQHIQMHVD
eukprot:1136490-Pelagomonas_calceolata.AAC.4